MVRQTDRQTTSKANGAFQFMLKFAFENVFHEWLPKAHARSSKAQVIG